MTTTTVRTYKNARTFSKDAGRMARAGYTVVATFQEPSKNKPLRNLLKTPVGGTLLWGSSLVGGRIVVTYQVSVAPPLAMAGSFGAPQGQQPYGAFPYAMPPWSAQVAPPSLVPAGPSKDFGSFGTRLARALVITCVLVGVLIVLLSALGA